MSRSPTQKGKKVNQLNTHARINELTTALASKDTIVRERARHSLVKIGSPATESLVELLEDRHHQLRWEAAKTLGEIADPRAAPALVSALRDEEFDVRWLAAVGLITMGPDALPPLLEELAKRPESTWLRQGTHHVLRNLTDQETKDMISPVLRALEGVEPEVGVIKPALKVADKLKRRRTENEGLEGVDHEWRQNRAR
jgi:HEAT repeat protein